MKVLYIRPSRSRGYTVIGFTGDSCEKENYTVSDAFFAGLSLSRDSEADEDVLLAIKTEDEIFRAKKKALSILSFGDNSKRFLYMKLRRAGISAEISTSVVNEMCNLGYINEDERLRRLIIEGVNVHFLGKMKLVPRLVSKGYSKGQIDNAISELSSEGEIDFAEARKKLIEKYLPEDASDEEIKKLLYKNGHGVC